jgi:hypothetical protein
VLLFPFVAQRSVLLIYFYISIGMSVASKSLLHLVSKLLLPYYKTWSKVSLGLKLMLSLLFAKRVTVTASVLNQD